MINQSKEDTSVRVMKEKFKMFYPNTTPNTRAYLIDVTKGFCHGYDYVADKEIMCFVYYDKCVEVTQEEINKLAEIK